jgi:hypothetical protein
MACRRSDSPGVWWPFSFSLSSLISMKPIVSDNVAKVAERDDPIAAAISIRCLRASMSVTTASRFSSIGADIGAAETWAT